MTFYSRQKWCCYFHCVWKSYNWQPSPLSWIGCRALPCSFCYDDLLFRRVTLSFLYLCLHFSHLQILPCSIYLFNQMTSPWWYAPVSVTIVRSTTSGPLWIMHRRMVIVVLCWITSELFPTSSLPLHACSLMVRPVSQLKIVPIWLLKKCVSYNFCHCWMFIL